MRSQNAKKKLGLMADDSGISKARQDGEDGKGALMVIMLDVKKFGGVLGTAENVRLESSSKIPRDQVQFFEFNEQSSGNAAIGQFSFCCLFD